MLSAYKYTAYYTPTYPWVSVSIAVTLSPYRGRKLVVTLPRTHDYH